LPARGRSKEIVTLRWTDADFKFQEVVWISCSLQNGAQLRLVSLSSVVGKHMYGRRCTNYCA